MGIKEEQHIQTLEVRGVETKHSQSVTDQHDCFGPGTDTGQESKSVDVVRTICLKKRKKLNCVKTKKTLALLAAAFTNDLVRRS